MRASCRRRSIPSSRMHVLWAALVGRLVRPCASVSRLDEDRDLLARDVLESVIAGLKVRLPHRRSIPASAMPIVRASRPLESPMNRSVVTHPGPHPRRRCCGGRLSVAGSHGPDSRRPNPRPPPSMFRSSPLSMGAIEAPLEISGTLAPRTRVPVKPRLPGHAGAVLVDIGDAVTAGQVIAHDRPTRDRRAGGRGGRRRRGGQGGARDRGSVAGQRRARVRSGEGAVRRWRASRVSASTRRKPHTAPDWRSGIWRRRTSPRPRPRCAARVRSSATRPSPRP